MKTALRIGLLLAALGQAWAQASDAAAPSGDPARLEALKSTLQARFPDAKIQSIAPAVIPGLYEVISSNLIVYTDATGEYVLMGPMIESRTRANLTDERLGRLRGTDYASLPAELAFRIVKGQGRRRMAVFADPFCPFCKELEQALEGMDDVAIDLFLLPLEGIHPGATAKARDIWCTADRARTWTAWMLRNEAVPAAPADCTGDPVARVQALAGKLRINSTPTIFFGDGTRMDGALSRPQLQRLLDRGAAQP